MYIKYLEQQIGLKNVFIKLGLLINNPNFVFQKSSSCCPGALTSVIRFPEKS